MQSAERRNVTALPIWVVGIDGLNRSCEVQPTAKLVV
jgi:hypothetical protein